MIRVKVRKDLVLYFLVVSGSLFLCATLSGLSYETRAFPTIALLCLGVVCVIGIGRSLSFSSRLQGKIMSAKSAPEKLIKVCGTLTGTAVYALLIPTVGFYASTCTFLIVLMLFLGNKCYALIVGSSMILLLLVYTVFTVFLNVPLPRGILL